MNSPRPTCGFAPANAAWVACPVVEIGWPPLNWLAESRPAPAKSVILAPAPRAQLIAAAEKPPVHLKAAVVDAIAACAAVVFRKRAAPTWFSSMTRGVLIDALWTWLAHR